LRATCLAHADTNANEHRNTGSNSYGYRHCDSYVYSNGNAEAEPNSEGCSYTEVPTNPAAAPIAGLSSGK
jgi:hypothetical protein